MRKKTWRAWTSSLLLLWCGLARWAAGNEADDQFAVAAGLYCQQRWELAIEEFRGFLANHATHPRAAEVRFLLAESLLQDGRADEAEAAYRDYLHAAPAGEFARAAMFRAGEAAYLAGRLGEARTDLTAFLARWPDDPLGAYALPYLGNISLSQGEWSEARELFRRGLDQYPEGKLQDDCRYGLARCGERLGDAELAERLYLALAAKASGKLRDDAQFRLAALQYAQQRYEEALASFLVFEGDLEDSAWRPAARMGRGWALFKLERHEEAGKLFAELADHPQLGHEARYWLGLTQRARGEWAAAARTLTAADTQTDASGRFTAAIGYHAADSLLRAGDVAAARAAFERALALPVEKNAWADEILLGAIQAASQANDHAAVERLVARWNHQFPQSPLADGARRLLVRSLIQQGEHQRALELLETIASPDASAPDYWDDQCLKAMARRGLGQHEEALALLDAVAAAAPPPLQATALLARGSILTSMKRHEEAIASLEKALEGDLETHDQAAALAELVVCEVALERFDAAATRLDRLAEDGRNSQLLAAATEQVAEAAYQARQWDLAGRMFDRLAHQQGSSEPTMRGLMGLAWSHSMAGRRAEAAAVFAQVLDRQPPAPVAAEAALARGQALEQEGQTDEALAMYDQVVLVHAETAQYPQALLAAARLRDRMQQDSEAATLYERLATRFPELPEMDAVLYEWSWVLYDLGQKAEADARFEELCRRYPQSRFTSDATYRLAQRAFAAGDWARAWTLARAGLDAQPEPRIREHTLFLLGQVAAAQQRWEEVAPPLDQLLTEFPSSSMRGSAQYLLAESHYRRGQFGEACTRLEQLAKMLAQAEPSESPPETWQPMVRLRLAQSLIQTGRWDEAYQTASAMARDEREFPLRHEVDYVLGRCLANQAEFDEARAAYQRVIRSREGAKTETAAMAQFMIGETFFHQKNYEAALREYLRLEILYAYPPWQAAALLQAGKCHQSLGQLVQARDCFTRVRKVYRETPLAEEAARLLQGMESGNTASRPPAAVSRK